MDHSRYWMWMTGRQGHGFPLRASINPSYDDSWVEQAFAEDSARVLGGCIWPPRSYSCSFCGREFRSAQALGGHMNVHRRDRARQKQSPSAPIDLFHQDSRSPYHFLDPMSRRDPVFHSSRVSPPSRPSRASTAIAQHIKMDSPMLSCSSIAEDDLYLLCCSKSTRDSNMETGDTNFPPHKLACLAKVGHVRSSIPLKRRKLGHDLSIVVGSANTTLDSHAHPRSMEELDLELRLGFGQREVQ